VPDWDERYRRGDHATPSPSRLLVRALDHLAPGRALDVACGAGRHAVYLAEHGWRVTAVEASRVGIELAERLARERGVEIDARVADLEKGEYLIRPGAFDLICVFYYLQRTLFSQIGAGLPVGGSLVAAIHVVDEDPASRLSNPAFSLQPGELRDRFSAWNITYYHEGKPHDGDHKRRTAEIIAVKPESEEVKEEVATPR
jgi:tellurite methyltransferase